MMLAVKDVEENPDKPRKLSERKHGLLRKGTEKMQRQYNRTLNRFYQSEATKYIKLSKKAREGNDSTDNEDTMLYMNSDENRNRDSEEEAPMLYDKNSRGHNKHTSVKPIQPRPFCSRRTCVLLIVWTLLFIAGVCGLTIFIQQILSKVAQYEQGGRRFVKYADYFENNYGKSSERASVVSCDDFEITPVWHRIFEKLQTETAIRFIDVNSDSIDDVIVSFGTGADGFNVPRVVCDLYFNGTFPCFGGAFALDGKTGKELWRHYSGHEIYAVNCNGDLNGDGIPDCLLGGRGGIFDAVDGKTGALLWAFWDKNVRSDVMNLYTAQFIRDFNGDGVMEVLQVHGGDPLAEAFSEQRLISRIIIFSGKTGLVLRWVETPDKKESYFSPVLYTLKNGTELVVFGTGGETHGGALYVIQLIDLYYGKIEKAVAIYKDELKGVMNPPVLIDLNKDGTVDMVMSMFNSTIAAIDGESLQFIWSYSVPNTESYSVPAPGYYNNDDTIDFMARFNYGAGFPVYYHSNITILDGKSGKPVVTSPFKTSGAANPSPLTISMQGKGNDLFLYWIADCLGHEGEGGKFSFVEGTNVHEQSRADTCRLRYNTRGFSRFSIMNRKTSFPGKKIYDSEANKELEHGPLPARINKINKRDTPKRKQLLKRILRHIGIPDHGGIQRLIATGGLTAALDEVPDRFGFTDSIDVVFPVYWMYPAKVRALSAKDIECVKKYRQLAKQEKLKIEIDIDKNRAEGNYDEGDTAVNYCLKNRTKHEKEAIFDSQSTYDPTKIHFGRLIVYRYNIKCICNKESSDQKCAKILPMSQQGWGGYMGSLANGFYNTRHREEKGQPRL